MRIDWESFKEAEEVQQAISAALGQNANVAATQTFLDSVGLEYSALIDDTIFCSISVSSELPFTRAKWLIELRFHNDQLVTIDVQKGFIGP